MRGLRISGTKRLDKFPASWSRRQRSKLPVRISSQKIIPLGNGKFIARQSHAISARQSGCAAFDPFHLSRFAKGANVSRSLLADSGVAGVSSGRLAVVISTPTIEAKAATVSFPKIDLENGVFQRSGSFLLLVTVVLLIRWSGYGRALSRRCFTATASKRQPSTAGCRARPH